MAEEIFIENGDHAILLFHAFTSYSKDFGLFSKILSREGYTVYAPNLSGHGEDDPDKVVAYRMNEWMEDGQRALNFLKEKGYSKISVFGLSLGGLVAIYLALENDDILSAGTFSSPVMLREGSNIEPNFKGWYVHEKQEQGFSEDEANEIFENKVKPQLEAVLESMETFKAEHMIERYKDLTIDFFVGQGGDDEMIDEDQVHEFVEALENANVTFKWYDKAGHVITVGKVGRIVREDLLAFLQGTK